MSPSPVNPNTVHIVTDNVEAIEKLLQTMGSFMDVSFSTRKVTTLEITVPEDRPDAAKALQAVARAQGQKNGK